MRKRKPTHPHTHTHTRTSLFPRLETTKVWCVLSCSVLKYYRESDVYSARGTAVVFEATPQGAIGLSPDSKVSVCSYHGQRVRVGGG